MATDGGAYEAAVDLTADHEAYVGAELTDPWDNDDSDWPNSPDVIDPTPSDDDPEDDDEVPEEAAANE